MSDLVKLQDTSGVPPRSRFKLRRMPADWNAAHPQWNAVEWPLWLFVNQCYAKPEGLMDQPY